MGSSLIAYADKKRPLCSDHFLSGRGERTRTFDLSVPNAARYQLRHTPEEKAKTQKAKVKNTLKLKQLYLFFAAGSIKIWENMSMRLTSSAIKGLGMIFVLGIAIAVFGIQKAITRYRQAHTKNDVALMVPSINPSVEASVLPAISPNPSSTPTNVPSPTPKPSPVLPARVNLNVPFTIQAPTGNWDEVHEETCEEAASLMAQWYVLGMQGKKDDTYQNKIPPDQAEQSFRAMIEWQNKTFGDFKDTTAEQTVQMLKENLGVKNARVTTTVTQASFKQELAKGNIILVPTAGQLLKNPNFKQPGPPYHMVVIRGYDGDNFITNDAGTRKGEGYVYSWKTLENATHDWTGNKDTIAQGKRVAIIIAK